MKNLLLVVALVVLFAGSGCRFNQAQPFPERFLGTEVRVMNGLSHSLVVQHNGREVLNLQPGTQGMVRILNKDVLTCLVLDDQGNVIGYTNKQFKLNRYGGQEFWEVDRYDELRH